MSHLDACILCGGSVPSPRGRFMSMLELQEFVSYRCIPTHFHYAAVAQLPSDGDASLCVSCVNWHRRSKKGRRFYVTDRGEKTRRVFTPFDSVLMHVLEPGHNPEPDHRCFARIVQTVIRPDNPFASLLPFTVRKILDEVSLRPRESLSKGLLMAWWEANARTPFFRHALTARMVRRAVKMQSEDELGVVRTSDTDTRRRRRWRR